MGVDSHTIHSPRAMMIHSQSAGVTNFAMVCSHWLPAIIAVSFRAYFLMFKPGDTRKVCLFFWKALIWKFFFSQNKKKINKIEVSYFFRRMGLNCNCMIIWYHAHCEYKTKEKEWKCILKKIIFDRIMKPLIIFISFLKKQYTSTSRITQLIGIDMTKAIT